MATIFSHFEKLIILNNNIWRITKGIDFKLSLNTSHVKLDCLKSKNVGYDMTTLKMTSFSILRFLDNLNSKLELQAIPQDNNILFQSTAKCVTFHNQETELKNHFKYFILANNC